jgi:hypothetical protein
MKNTLVLLAIVLMSSAASGDEAKIDFRLAGGATWARYTRLPSIVSIPEAGYELARHSGAAAGVGLELTFPFTGSMAIIHALEYTRKGTTLDWYLWDDPVGAQSYNLDTLDYSTFVKIMPFSKLGLFFLSGFSMSYILGHKLVDDMALPRPTEQYLMSATRRFDVGLLAGAGGEFVFKKWAVFAELRYHWGLLDLSRGTGPLDDYPVIRTRALVLLAGVRYSLAKREL